MAEEANIFRKATAELLHKQLEATRISAGILIKAYRAYKRPGKPKGLTQVQVAKAAGLTQPAISMLESGKQIPRSGELEDVLRECGIDVKDSPGRHFLKLLEFLRDHSEALEGLIRDRPQ